MEEPVIGNRLGFINTLDDTLNIYRSLVDNDQFWDDKAKKIWKLQQGYFRHIKKEWMFEMLLSISNIVICITWARSSMIC